MSESPNRCKINVNDGGGDAGGDHAPSTPIRQIRRSSGAGTPEQSSSRRNSQNGSSLRNQVCSGSSGRVSSGSANRPTSSSPALWGGAAAPVPVGLSMPLFDATSDEDPPEDTCSPGAATTPIIPSPSRAAWFLPEASPVEPQAFVTVDHSSSKEVHGDRATTTGGASSTTTGGASSSGTEDHHSDPNPSAPRQSTTAGDYAIGLSSGNGASSGNTNSSSEDVETVARRLGGGTTTEGGATSSTANAPANPFADLPDSELEELASIQLLPTWLLQLFGWSDDVSSKHFSAPQATSPKEPGATTPPDITAPEPRAPASSMEADSSAERNDESALASSPPGIIQPPEPQVLVPGGSLGIFEMFFDPRSCSGLFGAQHKSRPGSPSYAVVESPAVVIQQVKKLAGEETFADILDEAVMKEAPRWFTPTGPFQQPVMHLTTLLEGLQDGMGLVIFYFLKDHFQLSPAWLSVGFGLITLPWVAKPALAYITDTQYIFGQRRKPYMVLASLVTSLAYLGVGYQGIHSLPLAIFYLALAGAGRAFVLAALQGLIVEGTGGGARASGPLSEFFWLRSFGAVVAAYYGGLLLELVPASTILTGLAVLPLTICCMVSVFLTEEGRADNGEASARTPEKAWQEFCDAVSNPTFYGPIIYLLCYCCGPNYDDALYYFYSNELHFPPEMMGRISLSHSVARCVGIGIYNMFLQAVPARRLVIGATLLSLPLYITPVLITSGLYVKWGLSARWLALGGEMVRDAFLYVQLMPALTAATRVGPKGLEATTFALVTALGNAGKSVQRLTSAGTIAMFGVTAGNFAHLSNLVLFCGGTLLLPLLTLPFVQFADEVEDTEYPVAVGEVLPAGEILGGAAGEKWSISPRVEEVILREELGFVSAAGGARPQFGGTPAGAVGISLRGTEQVVGAEEAAEGAAKLPRSDKDAEVEQVVKNGVCPTEAWQGDGAGNGVLRGEVGGKMAEGRRSPLDWGVEGRPDDVPFIEELSDEDEGVSFIEEEGRRRPVH